MIGRLAVGVEFPMPAGIGIGRVEDRPLEKLATMTLGWLRCSNALS